MGKDDTNITIRQNTYLRIVENNGSLSSNNRSHAVEAFCQKGNILCKFQDLNTRASPDKHANPQSASLPKAPDREKDEEDEMSAEEDVSMISRSEPSRSDASDLEDSAESPPPSQAHPSEGSPLSPALSSWRHRLGY